MKYYHAEILFLIAEISWIDRLSAALLACHKGEHFGIYRWPGESDGARRESRNAGMHLHN
jgi:hypothetical protein